MKTVKTKMFLLRQNVGTIAQNSMRHINDRIVLRGSQTDKIFKTKPLKNCTSIKGYKH